MTPKAFKQLEDNLWAAADNLRVFRNMKKALAAYALGSDEQLPVQEKSQLFVLLDQALKEGVQYCKSIKIDITAILDEKDTFKNLEIFKTFADIMLAGDERRQEFFVYENTISSIYEACKPEILSKQKRPLVFVFQYLRGVIDSLIQKLDIDSAKRRIEELLDQSVITAEEAAEEGAEYNPVTKIKKGIKWNLANVDFEKLRENFKKSKYKNIEITDLRAFIQEKLEKMLDQNSTRTDFAQKFQEIIDAYNAGGASNESFFDDLMKFAEDLKSEDERHIREGLSEDELELFDTLKKDKITKAEEQKIKLAAQHLLKRLTEEHPRVLIPDWYKNSQSKAVVKSTVEAVLDKDLPVSYDRALFTKKCDNVFNLIYDYALAGKKWVA